MVPAVMDRVINSMRNLRCLDDEDGILGEVWPNFIIQNT